MESYLANVIIKIQIIQQSGMFLLVPRSVIILLGDQELLSVPLGKDVCHAVVVGVTNVVFGRHRPLKAVDCMWLRNHLFLGKIEELDQEVDADGWFPLPLL